MYCYLVYLTHEDYLEASQVVVVVNPHTNGSLAEPASSNPWIPWRHGRHPSQYFYLENPKDRGT